MTLHYAAAMMARDRGEGGVDALTRTLALEGRRTACASTRSRRARSRPRRADAFAPPPDRAPDLGFIERAMADHAMRTIPLGRWGAPEDIGNMVAFLASPAGDWVTGAIFVVDGGEWLKRPQ